MHHLQPPYPPMPAERYFIDQDLKEHQTLEIKDAEFHHMAHVMRTRKGERVEVINGRGALAQAIVQDLSRDRAVLMLEDLFITPPSPCRLILAQALPKANRLDFILEKGTELGVDEFWLFPGDLSAKKDFFPSQLERAQAVLISAIKQCGRLTLPHLALKPTLKNWPSFPALAFFGDLEEDAPLFETAWKEKGPFSLPVVFFTGPESGFSSEEVQLLRKGQAAGVKLHSNVLRTETASLMALSLLSHWLEKTPKRSD